MRPCRRIGLVASSRRREERRIGHLEARRIGRLGHLAEDHRIDHLEAVLRIGRQREEVERRSRQREEAERRSRQRAEAERRTLVRESRPEVDRTGHPEVPRQTHHRGADHRERGRLRAGAHREERLGLELGRPSYRRPQCLRGLGLARKAEERRRRLADNQRARAD